MGEGVVVGHTAVKQPNELESLSEVGELISKVASDGREASQQ
jgi:hypothetical protein